MSKVLKTILIILAVFASLTGLGFLIYNYNKKKDTVTITVDNSKPKFNLDELIKSQPQMVAPQPANLIFNLNADGTSPDSKDEFYIVRARNTSKDGALDKVYLLDFYNPKTGVWGYDKEAHLTEDVAKQELSKLTSSIAFKGIPQTEVEIYVVPKYLLVLNANAMNNYAPNNYSFAEVREPQVFQGEVSAAHVIMFTGGIFAFTGILFSALSAAVGGVLAITGVIYSATRLAWIKSYTHRTFKRVVIFKKA